MHRVLVVLAVLGGCSKVVKQEGFRATIAEADDPKVEGTFEALGDPSCGRFQPDRREVHLKADRFVLDVLEEPFSGKDRAVSLVIDGERYVSDRPGAETATPPKSNSTKAVGLVGRGPARPSVAHHTGVGKGLIGNCSFKL